MPSWILSRPRCSYPAALVAGLALSSAVLASAPQRAHAAEQADTTPAKAAASKTAEKPQSKTAEKPQSKTAEKPQSKAAAKAPSKAAGSPKPAERERARQLVLEGDAAHARGHFARALELYSQAYQLVHVPTVGIEVVKALTALGRLVEAQATAHEVASAPKQRGEPAVFEEARQRAAQSNLRLTGMIPSLWLEVSPPGVVFEVEIDGEAPSTPPPYRLNPGAHQVRVQASGYEPLELGVTLKEAERLNRRADLLPEGGSAAHASAGSKAAGAGVAAAASAGAVKDASAREAAAGGTFGTDAPAAAESGVEDVAPAGSRQGSSLRSLGWVGLGVAAVAAGAGTYAGIRAFSTKPDCPNDTCAPSQQDDIDSSTRMGTIANVSVGIAVVAGALGIWALASGEDDGSEGGSASLSELPVTVGLGKLKEIRVSGRF